MKGFETGDTLIDDWIELYVLLILYICPADFFKDIQCDSS